MTYGTKKNPYLLTASPPEKSGWYSNGGRWCQKCHHWCDLKVPTKYSAACGEWCPEHE